MIVYILTHSTGVKCEGGNDIILGVYSSKELAYLAAREFVPQEVWKELE